MTLFTPDDHVTEREVGSAWEDCTLAALLETFRLALPNGRAIPATIEEVNRFRAAMGLPDNHKGVTISRCIPTAKRLYGLTDDDYILTDDWTVLAPALDDPIVVATVTGKMGAFPATVHRWDDYTGPHAVAKHGVRVMCDPLAPHGTYQGEQVALTGWAAFFLRLRYSKALLMRTTTGGTDGMISAGGIVITSDHIARVKAETPILDAPGGERIATARIGYEYPYLGAASGWRACLVTTPIPYPDHLARPTVLYLAANAVVIEDAH